MQSQLMKSVVFFSFLAKFIVMAKDVFYINIKTACDLLFACKCFLTATGLFNIRMFKLYSASEKSQTQYCTTYAVKNDELQRRAVGEFSESTSRIRGCNEYDVLGTKKKIRSFSEKHRLCFVLVKHISEC